MENYYPLTEKYWDRYYYYITKNKHMSMEFRHITKQQQTPQATQEQFKKAPILHSLQGIEKFTETLRQSLQTPRAKTALFIFGEPGAGKEIVAGQFLESLLHPVTPESVSPLPQDLRVGYVSFGMAMKIARDPVLSQKYEEQQVTRTDGNYTQEEYQIASRIM